jgi:hypothetical protein
VPWRGFLPRHNWTVQHEWRMAIHNGQLHPCAHHIAGAGWLSHPASPESVSAPRSDRRAARECGPTGGDLVLLSVRGSGRVTPEELGDVGQAADGRVGCTNFFCFSTPTRFPALLVPGAVVGARVPRTIAMLYVVLVVLLSP